MIDPARAARPWGGLRAPPRLAARRENTVWDVRLPAGRAALRVHRPGYRDARGIEAELRWTEALAARGVPCPAPLRGRSGALLGHCGGAVVSCVTWIDAAPFEPSAPAMRTLGGLIAGLHAASDAAALPPPPRAPWDLDSLTGPEPLWGRYWRSPALDAAEGALLLRARDAARERLPGIGDVGMIHGDLLRENVLAGPCGLHLIDFDDAGLGWRAYDLATALVQSVGDPGMPGLRDALLEGYLPRRALPGADALPMFVALRAMASAGWAMTRLPPGAPALRGHAARAVAAVAEWAP